MADQKLSELTLATGAVSSDLLYVVQGATSKKIAFSSVVSSISALIDISSYATRAYLSSVAQSIIPATDSIYDLGSPTKRWNSIYVSGSTIYIGETTLSVSGSTLSIGTSTVISSGNAGTELPLVVSSLGTISTITLDSAIRFYSGTSIVNLTAGTGFSSAQISAGSSSLFVVNPTPATITSVLNSASVNSIVFASTSSANTSYGISFKVDSAASYTTGDAVEVTLYSGPYESSYTLNPGTTFTATTSANATKAHVLRVIRVGIPQFVDLVEGSEFTVTGTLITVNTTVSAATQVTLTELGTGPAGLAIPVSALTSTTDVIWANNSTQFNTLSLGHTTSTAIFDGSQSGRLVYINPNGVKYYSDGSIIYPNGLSYDSSGTIILPTGAKIKNAVGDVLIDETSSYVAAAELTSTLISYPTFTDVTSILTSYATDSELTSGISAASSALSTITTDKIEMALLLDVYTSASAAMIAGNTVTLDARSKTIKVDMYTSISNIVWINLPPAGRSADVDVTFTQTTTGNTFTLPASTGNISSIKSSVSSLSTTSGKTDGLRFRLFNDSLSPFTTSVSVFIYPLWSGL
jgi:hypothetical protein